MANKLEKSNLSAIYGDMKIEMSTPTGTVLGELGSRIRQQRIAQNHTQAGLAAMSGVPVRTIERLEAGVVVGLDKWVQVLRALHLAPNFDQLLPEAAVAPMEQLRSGKLVERRRASASRARKPDPEAAEWVWGDRK